MIGTLNYYIIGELIKWSLRTLNLLAHCCDKDHPHVHDKGIMPVVIAVLAHLSCVELCRIHRGITTFF